MRNRVLGLDAIAATAVTTGRESIKGAGPDITNAGEAIEGAAR
jgi:predicted small secreted protein